MHSSKISLDSGSHIIILNPKLDLIHRSGILMQLKKFLNFGNKFRTVDGEEEYEEGEDDYEDEGEPEGDEGEDPEPEGEDPSGSVNHINQMTMCIRGKSKTSAVAASSSSTERVGSESHRVDEINLVEKFQSIGVGDPKR